MLERSAPTAGALKAAEGETVVAVVVIRRVDGGIEVEVVRAVSTRVSTRRPPVAFVASVPESTSGISQIEVPAAHDQDPISNNKVNLTRGAEWFRSLLLAH